MAVRYEIGIVGAGFSGICAAIQLQKKFSATSISVTIFEKNADVGGTWFNNVYPGCASDVASHLYSFSFELNPNWSKNYPPQPEMLEYLKGVTRKYKIRQRIKFQHEVKTMSWDEGLKKWIVQYVDVSSPNAEEETKTFDIIINAPGAIRIPFVPDEFSAFTGPKMHTAEWNHEIDLKNKKVAVIGSGASAVQVIPSIVDDVDVLHCYQRKPPYIIPRVQFKFPYFLKAIFNYLPFIMWLYRCILYWLHELLHAVFIPDTILHRIVGRATKAYRHHTLKQHQHLWDDVTPKYGLGCKRVIVSEQYYAAMARPNVKLHSSHIEKIVERAIYTKDGTKAELDVLILATGFRASDYFSPMEVIGKGGRNILKSWIDDRPRSFYGVAFSDTPNYFYLLGPNTVLGHNSVVFMIECQVDFITNAIGEMMKRDAEVINLKSSAEGEFMDRLDTKMKDTIWGKESCGSWYANPRGDITILWSDNTRNYWWETRNVDWSNFDFM